jgi:hypothetical protein
MLKKKADRFCLKVKKLGEREEAGERDGSSNVYTYE